MGFIFSVAAGAVVAYLAMALAVIGLAVVIIVLAALIDG
jgi:hypothetical protein